MRKLITGEECWNLIHRLGVMIHYTDLGGSCKGLSCKYADGYIILIERSMCLQAMAGTIQHELCHIVLGHLDDDTKSDQQKEMEVYHELSKMRK